MMWQVYFTAAGGCNWGPDELYGDYGESQDENGRPLYHTEDSAMRAVKELNDGMDATWPKGCYAYCKVS